MSTVLSNVLTVMLDSQECSQSDLHAYSESYPSMCQAQESKAFVYVCLQD